MANNNNDTYEKAKVRGEAMCKWVIQDALKTYEDSEVYPNVVCVDIDESEPVDEENPPAIMVDGWINLDKLAKIMWESMDYYWNAVEPENEG